MTVPDASIAMLVAVIRKLAPDQRGGQQLGQAAVPLGDERVPFRRPAPD